MEKDEISREVFQRYEKLRKSGKINMFEVKNVCLLADISREEAFTIMKNYSYLREKWRE